MGGCPFVTTDCPLDRGQLSGRGEPLREIGLRDAEDDDIFAAARDAGVIMLTKDSDFNRLLEQHGSPPKVLWLTCGNTSDAALQEILGRHLSTALNLLEGGEDLVEIGSP